MPSDKIDKFEVVGATDYGRLWIFPVGSSDHTRVTADVISYEDRDGALHLAESAGELAGPVEFQYDDSEGADAPEFLDPQWWTKPGGTP